MSKRKLSRYQQFAETIKGYIKKKKLRIAEKGGISRVTKYLWDETASFDLDYWSSDEGVEILFKHMLTVTQCKRLKKGKNGKYDRRLCVYIGFVKDKDFVTRGQKLYDWLLNNSHSWEWWFGNDKIKGIQTCGHWKMLEDNLKVTDEHGVTVTFDNLHLFMDFFNRLKRNDAQPGGRRRQKETYGFIGYPTFAFDEVWNRAIQVSSYTALFNLRNYVFEPEDLLPINKGNITEQGQPIEEVKTVEEPPLKPEPETDKELSMEIERRKTKEIELEIEKAKAITQKEITRQKAMDLLEKGLIDKDDFKLMIK